MAEVTGSNISYCASVTSDGDALVLMGFFFLFGFALDLPPSLSRQIFPNLTLIDAIHSEKSVRLLQTLCCFIVSTHLLIQSCCHSLRLLGFADAILQAQIGFFPLCLT